MKYWVQNFQPAKVMPEEKNEELIGVCEFFTKTGTEGGDWAFHDNAGRGPNGIYWSYKGLRILEDGDHLIIYHPKKKNRILWSGIIRLKQLPIFYKTGFGFWTSSEQTGADPEKWAKWFFREYPAKLIPIKK